MNAFLFIFCLPHGAHIVPSRRKFFSFVLWAYVPIYLISFLNTKQILKIRRKTKSSPPCQHNLFKNYIYNSTTEEKKKHRPEKPHLKILYKEYIKPECFDHLHLPGSPKLNQQDSWVSSRGLGIALLLGPLGIASPTSGNAEIFIFETNPNSGRDNSYSVFSSNGLHNARY